MKLSKKLAQCVQDYCSETNTEPQDDLILEALTKFWLDSNVLWDLFTGDGIGLEVLEELSTKHNQEEIEIMLCELNNRPPSKQT